jgi:hypothetical protein
LLDFDVEKGSAARKNQLRKKMRVNYFFVWVVILRVCSGKFASCETSAI